MKKLLVTVIGCSLASISVAANYPGATISRANCWAPFPKSQLTPTGSGWYNESFTYDRTGFAKYLTNSTDATNFDLRPYYHLAYVVSDQKDARSSKVTRLASGSGYTNSWRVYAGRAQPALLPYPQTGPYYSVTGSHRERLNSGIDATYSTFSRECFDVAYI